MLDSLIEDGKIERIESIHRVTEKEASSLLMKYEKNQDKMTLCTWHGEF